MEIQRPYWLPPTIDIKPEMPSKWLVNKLWRRFQLDFMNADCKPRYKGRPVWWDRNWAEGYHLGFWHIVTKDHHPPSPDSIDLERACRLSWCLPVIQHWDQPDVKAFKWQEAKGCIWRTYLWLERLDYVVILQKEPREKGEIARLITAYHVSGDWTRKQFRERYEQWIKNAGTAVR